MSDPGKQRLFVGNLSSDTTEDDLKKLFKKFKVADVEIRRKKTLDDEAVFAYVNISKKRVDECLNTLYGYKWKDQGLKIEVAKENFLDRLKKERLQREEKESYKKSKVTSFLLNNYVPKNKKIKFDLENDSPSYNENCEGTIFKKNVNGSDEDDESGCRRKRNLPMFRGIANVENHQDISENATTRKSFQENGPIEEKNRESGVETSMKRFEDFSSVWRDDVEDNFIVGNTDLPNDSYSGERKSLKKQRRNESENKFEHQKTEKLERGPMKSKNVSEMKRRSALEQKWNSVREKKNLVQNALRNINVRKETLLPNEDNMTVLDDVEIASPTQNGISPLRDSVEQPVPSDKKRTLFDSSDEDAPEPNFEVRSYLGGDEGLKRLRMKSKLASDERFRIDERFFDANETQTMTENNVENQKPGSMMKRYDPEQTSQPRKEKEKKRKKIEKKKTEIEPETKPEVSKEKHYVVSENLWEAFREKDLKTSFSLSAMFDSQLNQNKSKSCEEKKTATDILQKNQKFISNPMEDDNPFKDEDTDEECEKPVDVLPLAVPPEKILGRCGVWGETFFFKPDDSRLKEAASFYQSSKSQKEDFGKRRKQLRSIVKKKIQNSRRDNRVFKRKLGGKIDRTKFKMRLKRIRNM